MAYCRSIVSAIKYFSFTVKFFVKINVNDPESDYYEDAHALTARPIIQKYQRVVEVVVRRSGGGRQSKLDQEMRQWLSRLVQHHPTHSIMAKNGNGTIIAS